MTAPTDDLAFQSRLQPDRPALVDLTLSRFWSYGELDASVASCVRVLHVEFKLLPGDRVAALAKNCATLLIIHLACARCGLIYVPLNWRLNAAENSAILADAEPALLVTGPPSGALNFTGFRIEIQNLQSRIDASAPLRPASRDVHMPSLILYTSGTSGRPKGVLLSEHNLEQTAISFGLLGQVTSRSVFLVDSPMFHIIGLVTSLRPVLRLGGSALISDGFDASRTLQRLSDNSLGITHYFCVPQMASALRAATGYNTTKLGRLTAIFTGGAPHPAPNIRAWLADGVSIVDGFGMSEAGTVFGMPIDRSIIYRKAGCVGIPPPGVEAKLVDELGQECPDDIAGELLLRGANITRGYWRRPDESANAFSTAGWFRTGDIAVRDGEGFYRIIDRKKDMFISGGENIYPAEIEAQLALFAGLRECAVIAVPDEQWGEVGHALVVVAEGVSTSSESIKSHLARALARYKIPKYVTFVDSLPRTASGKILKRVLRSQISGPTKLDASKA